LKFAGGLRAAFFISSIRGISTVKDRLSHGVERNLDLLNQFARFWWGLAIKVE
jgi:hypothetical protein